MKFLLDANIPRSSLEIFKALSIKATHVSDVGLQVATDQEVAAYAKKQKSIIVTRDLGFGTYAALSKNTVYGIVVLKLPFYFTAEGIKAVLRAFLITAKLETLPNSLVIVELGRYRIRRLRA